MNAEIGIGGFNTTYSVNGDIEQPKEKMACFARTLCQLYATKTKVSFSNNYTIYLFKERKGMHCIFISLDQMKVWFDLLKDIVNFEYSIEDAESEYILNVNIEGPRIVHLFILTGLRYVYEWPQSCLLLWAFKCKEEVPEFKEASLLSLVHTLRVFIAPALRSLGTGHIYPSIQWDGIPYKIVSNKDLKKHFEEIKIDDSTSIPYDLGSLFKQKKLYEMRQPSGQNVPYGCNVNENRDGKMNTINYWTDFSNLQKEYPKIIELYKLLSSN